MIPYFHLLACFTITVTAIRIDHVIVSAPNYGVGTLKC
jgi:hypothetical protein